MTIVRGIILFTVLNFIVVFSALAGEHPGEKPIVAVFNMEDKGSGLSTKVLDNLTNYLVVQLAGGGYQVIPRDEIRERLRRQKKESYRMCYDQKCQIELGRELAAQMSLSSVIMKMGGSCQVNAILYDLKKAATAQAASAEAPCDEKSLLKAIRILVSKIRLAPEEGGVGILLIKTAPQGLKVKVDGETVGTSPVTVKDLSAGHHVVEAEKGDVKIEHTAKVIGGEVTRIALDLTGKKFFSVMILTEPPEAQVNWDGRDYGKAPVVVKNVEQGSHNLVLSLSGYLQKEEKVEISADQEVNVKLLPETRTVKVVTNPPGAEVWVAGKSHGQAPVEVVLAAGTKHVIAAVAKDYKRIGWELEVVPAVPGAPPQEVKLNLEPEPVAVKVSVSPPEARVVIGEGEQKAERVGPGETKAIPGRRKVVGILDGYETVEREVDLSIGKAGKVDLTLEPLPTFVAYKKKLSSKRWQAWGCLGVTLVATVASWTMLKWSVDSQDAAEEWYSIYKRELNRDAALTALDKTKSFDDRATWTQAVGYSSIGIAAIALGWSIYSFFTMPERPTTWSVAPTPSTDGTGGQVVVGGSF